MRKYGSQGISMREIAKVAGVTTQTLMNGIRLLEPYFEEMDVPARNERKNPKI